MPSGETNYTGNPANATYDGAYSSNPADFLGRDTLQNWANSSRIATVFANGGTVTVAGIPVTNQADLQNLITTLNTQVTTPVTTTTGAATTGATTTAATTATIAGIPVDKLFTAILLIALLAVGYYLLEVKHLGGTKSGTYLRGGKRR